MNFFAISALVNGILSISSGLFVLKKDIKSHLHKAFAFFAFSVFFWSFGYFFWQLSNTADQALFWSRVFMAGAIMIPVAYFNFGIFLTDNYSRKSFSSTLSYLICLIFLVINFTPFIVKSVTKKMFFDLWPEPGELYPLFLLMFFYYVLFSLYLMYKKFMGSSGDKKKQIMYVFIGTAIGFIGGSTNYFLWYDIPIPPFLNILVSVYVAMVAFAITKHELMDIRVVIGRGLAYGIVGTIILSSFVVIFLLPLPKIILFFLSAALALVWAWAAHRLRDIIQTPLEEKWITGFYNSDKLMNSIATKLIPAIEKEAVFKIIAEELKAAVKIKNIEVAAGKPKTEYQDITPTKDGVVIPLSSSEGIEGALLLGPKISEDSYDQKDFLVFKTIAIQARAIFDRIRPYEKIKKDFEATQKKLYDTDRELYRSQRLASIGTLTAGVTHEIRNPLGIIRSGLEILPKQTRDATYLKDFRDKYVRHVDRIESIVEKVLGLAREEKTKTERLVNLNSIIEETLNFLQIDGKIKTVTNLQPLPLIKGVPEDIERVLINLLDNAKQAMPDGGTISVNTHAEKKEDGDGQRVIIEISDTGIGIPEENLEKIFDPFFSGHHEGTGLGLSIAHRIIKEHGADINVKSAVGKGTTFKITFNSAG